MSGTWPMRSHGAPVPFITQWSGELVDPRLNPIDVVGNTVSYRNSSMLDRDSCGVLWGRFTNAPGHGEPLWAQVHIGRQRQAMRQLRCQICATVLDQDRTPWLLPGQEWAALADAATWITSTAPCCTRCWHVADRRCPYLGTAPSWRGFLHRSRRWGVVGDIFLSTGIVTHGTVADGSPNMPLTVAKQLVVAFDHADPA